MGNFIPVASPQLNGNEKKYINECIDTNWISSKGEFVDRFEDEFSNYCNVEHGVSTSNGTVAIHLALKALNIGKGDEVIVPNLTFAATANAVIYTGATPVLVDVNEESWTIDPKAIEENISSNTKAIIPVHLYGQPADMDKILDIANENELYVIEDSAEAHGARYKVKKVGSFGDIACFSFYGNKIITTGEGGMCLTDDKNLKDKMEMLRDHGMDRDKRYWHNEVGFNYRMTNLQAAVGVGQLEKVDEIIQKRNWIKNTYDKYLKDIPGITLQKKLSNRDNVCWMYSILINKKFNVTRDELSGILKNNNIGSRPFFYPLDEMDIYKEYRNGNKLNNSKLISRQGLNLPTSLNLSEDDIKRITKVIKSEV